MAYCLVVGVAAPELEDEGGVDEEAAVFDAVLRGSIEAVVDGMDVDAFAEWVLEDDNKDTTI